MLRGYRRGALILVVILILMLGLMFLTKHAPTAYVPDISEYKLRLKTVYIILIVCLVSAYQHILRVSTFCYLLHITIMWLELYPPKSKPYPWLISVLNYSPLRLLLCMSLSDVSLLPFPQKYFNVSFDFTVRCVYRDPAASMERNCQNPECILLLNSKYNVHFSCRYAFTSFQLIYLKYIYNFIVIFVSVFI